MMIHRLPPVVRLWAATSLLAVQSFISSGAACAADIDNEGEASRVETAVARGLDWLVSVQQPDGSWGSGSFRGSAAVTATCTMALVGAGNTGESGDHARAVARAVRFLAASAGGSGLLEGREQAAHGPMYGHAFATTALAELYGETEEDETLAGVLDRARLLIERTQNDEGGWRYQPIRRDADISVTAGMLTALRALRNSGFDVSESTVDRGLAYIGRLQNPDGGFRYQSTAGPSAAPRTAAAVFSLIAGGVREGEGIDRGLAWLEAHPVRLGENVRLESGDGYALYGLFYTAAALWQRGGKGWDDWYEATADALIAAQAPDGSWQDPSCREYGTSAALSVLQMPRDLMPIFQRDRASP